MCSTGPHSATSAELNIDARFVQSVLFVLPWRADSGQAALHSFRAQHMSMLPRVRHYNQTVPATFKLPRATRTQCPEFHHYNLQKIQQLAVNKSIATQTTTFFGHGHLSVKARTAEQVDTCILCRD